jgi:hypothetical protein
MSFDGSAIEISFQRCVIIYALSHVAKSAAWNIRYIRLRLYLIRIELKQKRKTEKKKGDFYWIFVFTTEGI